MRDSSGWECEKVRCGFARELGMNVIGRGVIGQIWQVVALAAVLCLSGCARDRGMETEPLVNWNTPEALRAAFHEGTEARHERFNAISREGKAKLVFLGDSITEGWEGAGAQVWEAYYGPATGRHAANFGIGGDRTEHVVWRLEHGNFDGLKPKLIVLMIGTNNAGHRKDPAEETAAGVSRIVSALQSTCPDSKILVLGIFPRGDRLDDPDRVLNEQVNAKLGGYADGKRVRYRDIGATFLDADGLPRRDLMPDLLHLSPAGYALWAEAIEPDVKWGMGE